MAGGEISPSGAHFISLFCETYLFGEHRRSLSQYPLHTLFGLAEQSLKGFQPSVYTVIFFALLSRYRRRHATRSATSPIIKAVTILQFCISLTHVALALRQNSQAFIVNENADEAFDEIGSAVFTLAQMALEFTNCILADSILIWRVYVLWNRRVAIIVLPVLLVLASGSAGYVVVYEVSTNATASFSEVFGPNVEKWAITLAACTVLTNLLCTGLIAGRIWFHNRQLKRVVGVTGMTSRYRKVFLALLESGALYSLSWIVLVIVYLINDSAIVPMLDIISQLTGIIPTLIVIIVSRSLDAETRRAATLSSMHFTRETKPNAEPVAVSGLPADNSRNMRRRSPLDAIPMTLTSQDSSAMSMPIHGGKVVTFMESEDPESSNGTNPSELDSRGNMEAKETV